MAHLTWFCTLILQMMHWSKTQFFQKANITFLMRFSCSSWLCFDNKHGRLQRGFQSLLWGGRGSVQHHCLVWSRRSCGQRNSSREITLRAGYLRPLGRHSHVGRCSRLCLQRHFSRESIWSHLTNSQNYADWVMSSFTNLQLALEDAITTNLPLIHWSVR